MRIRGKLRRAHGGMRSDAAGPRSLLQRRAARLVTSRVPVELPAGQDLRNDRGTCYLRRRVIDLTARHGRVRLGEALSIDHGRLAELARAEDRTLLDPRRWLFLDTETTGLSGGAGTLVFLCGLGFFQPEGFVLEQVFMRACSEEAALLEHVARRLAERPVLVTFVGKCFDRHRLAARMTIHRVAAPVLTAGHLDLYYLARRRFGARLPDCRLRTLEEQVLDVRRTDDLPGAEAPEAFWSWIHDRSGRIDRVLEHNLQDVLSLVVLLARLGRG